MMKPFKQVKEVFGETFRESFRPMDRFATLGLKNGN
jgi:hypothetical protein